jgi:hypothetical protein
LSDGSSKNPNTLSLDRVFGFSKTCLSVTEPEIRIRSTGLFCLLSYYGTS